MQCCIRIYPVTAGVKKNLVLKNENRIRICLNRKGEEEEDDSSNEADESKKEKLDDVS